MLPLMYEHNLIINSALCKIVTMHLFMQPAAGDETISFEPAALLYDREDKLLRANLRIPDRRTYNTTQLATATAFFAQVSLNQDIYTAKINCWN